MRTGVHGGRSERPRARAALPYLFLLLGGTMALAASGPAAASTQILARAWVPNALLRQGEVRLVQRGAETVVQTVLDTSFPGRVRDGITDKETASWGADHPGAQAYLATLRDAFEEYRNRKESADETPALAIEYIAGPDPRVAFAFPVVRRDKAGLATEPAPAWRTIEPAGGYVASNQVLIVRDAFGSRADEVVATLERLRSSGAQKGGTP